MLRMTSLRGLLFSLPAPKPANAATSGAARLLLTRGLVSSSGSNQSGTMVTTNRVADPSAIQMVFSEIHCSLDHGDQESRKLTDIATYYFDGKGKVTRPVLTMLMAQALNQHLRLDKDNVIPSLSADQRKIALAAEMYHTASLMHDDVIDHAEMRRGKESVNQLWGQQGSIRAGDYSVAIATKEVAEMKQPEVLIAMTRILQSLVLGEFQQMSRSDNNQDRFQRYIDKTFNKTASLMAYSCKAVAILAVNQNRGGYTNSNRIDVTDAKRDELDLVNIAYEYGRNLGIAFQLVDDWLDFSADAKQLGKPAAADLKLGLATAPVLFACEQHPELESLISRSFADPGDVEKAFQIVLNSNGLRETMLLAESYASAALNNLRPLRDSEAKIALEDLAIKVVTRSY